MDQLVDVVRRLLFHQSSGDQLVRNVLAELDPLLDAHATGKELLGMSRVRHRASLLANAGGCHGGTLTVVAGKGLVDEQTVTIEYEIRAGKRMVILVLTGAAILFFLYLMVGAFREGDVVGAVLWSAAIAGLSWLYYRVLNIHVRIDGGRFSTRSLTGPEFQGGVEEFIGAEDNPTRAHWALLRRADLRIVQVPWDTHDRHSEVDRRIGASLSSKPYNSAIIFGGKPARE